jgi:hypothetical protein
MNSKLLFIVILSFFFLKESVAQTSYHYSKVQYTYGPYYFSEGLNVVKDIIAYRRIEEKRAKFEAEMQERTDEVRDYYKSLEKYPEKIADGWHTVTIVAGSSFIDNRKVFVEKNKIKKVYWDNWMEEKLVSAGPILKGTCKIQLDTENPNLNRFLDIYFINYIGNPEELESPPIKLTTLTFWTNENSVESTEFIFNGIDYGQFKMPRTTDNPPSCGDLNEISIYVKPGIYSYSAVYERDGQKTTLADTKIAVKEGDCQTIQVQSKADIEKKMSTITFWTSVSNPDHVSLKFNGVKYGRFKSHNSVDNPPACKDINEITVHVKPGIYSYKAVYEKGNNVTLVDKRIEVKEGDCQLIYIPTKREARKNN